jgi:hypothetical protein
MIKRPPRREATQSTYTPRPRAQAVAVSDGKARAVVSVPKIAPVRDENYRRLVAMLPCAHCGKAGPSQAAHADEGKGLGMKACDLTCYPLCADSPGRRGCHSVIGASGAFTRDQRRALEAGYAAKTRKALGR